MGAPRGQVTNSNAAENPIASQRSKRLQLAASRTARLRWSRRLLELLLDELYVDDDYFALLGGRPIPKKRYPQAVAMALLRRHAWRADDFEEVASRLGLTKRGATSRPVPARHRGRSA